jgi:hypothetical protein
VGDIEYLLIGSNSSILKLVLNGAEPIIGIQWLSGLDKSRGIGVLEISKLGARFIITITTIVVVVGGNLGKVLKCGKVCLTLGACCFKILHH